MNSMMFVEYFNKKLIDFFYILVRFEYLIIAF